MFLTLSDLQGQGQVHVELEKEKIGLPVGKSVQFYINNLGIQYRVSHDKTR